MESLNVSLDMKLKVGAYMEYYWANQDRDTELEEEVITRLDSHLK